MTKTSTSRSGIGVHRHHAIILLFALVVHGLLLLNDGVYYDGWLVQTFVKFGNWDRLYHWFSDSGMTQVYYMHLWLNHLPNPIFCYKLLAFLSIALSGLLIYAISYELGLVGRFESLLIALFALCYPAFQAAPEITILPYPLCYTIFLLGVLLALRAEGVTTPRKLLIIFACCCFFASFLIRSLLVFYAGFLWILAVVIVRQNGGRKDNLWRELLLRRLYYWLLPVAYWVVKQVLVPTRGAYGEYNQFKFSLGSLIYNFRTFLAGSIYDQFNAALTQIDQPVQWLLLLLAAQCVYVGFRLARRQFNEGAIPPTARLWFGCALLLLGIAPYVLVGKAPEVSGFNTRHALLVGLPMAIILVSVIQLLFSRDRVGEGSALSNKGWVLLSVLLVLFSTSLLHSYIAWQVRWIKSRAVMQALAHNPASRAYSTYWIQDSFNTGQQDHWVFLEWSSLFRSVWKDETRAGMDLANPDLWRTLVQHASAFAPPASSHFNLSHWNPQGRQADLTIARGAASTSNVRLVARYYLYKYLKPGGMPGFLQQVAKVDVRPAARYRRLPLQH